MTRRSEGFGLIELMVAMTLGLLVLGAAIAIFQSNQRSFQSNEGLNRVQEGARVAFELMSRDLRSAGGSGCSSASTIETSGGNSDLFKSSALTGSATEFTATSGDDTNYVVTASSPNWVDLANQDGSAISTDAFRTNDWVLLCNSRKTFVTQISGAVGNRVTFVSALPDSYNVRADALVSPTTAVLAKFRSARWYLDGNRLMVQREGAAGQAVADGVQSMAVSYLNRGAAAYTAAPGNDVIAVRFNLALRAQRDGADLDAREPGSTMPAFITRTVTNVVNLRARTL